MNPIMVRRPLAHVALSCLLLTNQCLALPDDQKQTLHLSAGSANLENQAHRGEYLTDVQLDQGTTHIRAAKAITIGNSQNQLTKAIIEGDQNTQAHYWTLPDPKKPPVHAYADTIYYFPNTHLIELVGNARVVQGEDSFSAAIIRYDTLHQQVTSQSHGKGRTTIIFHPSTHP